MSDAPTRLDASGLRCPEPLMLLRQRMRQLAPGDRLEVLTTDPASVRDFEQFSRFVGHSILKQEEAEGVFTFLFECAPR
ncbi:MAG: sulfurtransferase TusA [Gammaproteobacteria bacterium]|jgi:tRNA 2-thiouridine synthesizing protein A|nr:sulfurtransferase TusA [Gammaproteobacteria bacterium]